MTISFSVKPGVERGTVYLSVPTGIGADKKTTVETRYRASKDELAEVLMFAGILKTLAKSMIDHENGPVVIYNPADFDQHGPDLPYGFQFSDDES